MKVRWDQLFSYILTFIGWSKGILQEAALLLRRQAEIAPNAKLSSTSVNSSPLFGDVTSVASSKKKN